MSLVLSSNIFSTFRGRRFQTSSSKTSLKNEMSLLKTKNKFSNTQMDTFQYLFLIHYILKSFYVRNISECTIYYTRHFMTYLCMYHFLHKSLSEIFIYVLFTTQVILRNIYVCTIYSTSHSTKYLCMYHLLHKSMYEIFLYVPFTTQVTVRYIHVCPF